MTLEQLIPALIQLPFLGIFVWFALRMLSDFRVDSTNRDEMWRIFLAEERQRSERALDRGLAEVRHLSEALERLAKASDDHDARSDERHALILRKLDGEKG
jgi:hypothetical protein